MTKQESYYDFIQRKYRETDLTDSDMTPLQKSFHRYVQHANPMLGPTNDVIGSIKGVNRFEVIDHINGNGNRNVYYLSSDQELQYSFQDDGKTLKMFMSKNETD